MLLLVLLLTLSQNEDPVRVLTDYTEILFSSGLCKQARALACTTQEIMECLKDIRVLGKKDLKLLLQWREQCRQHLGLETEGDDAVKVEFDCFDLISEFSRLLLPVLR